MANSDDKPTLKITLEDLARVELPAQAPAGNMAAAAAGARQYGNVAAPADGPAVVTEEKGHFFLQGWFYLGVAGLIGALIGWGICEPFYRSPGRSPFLSFILLPLVIMFTCTGLGVAESIVERSGKKALIRAMLSLSIGAVFGLIFYIAAAFVYDIGRYIIFSLGVETNRNPAFWLVRGVAWATFGVAGGIVYGLVDRSGAKTKYGILGGLIGAGLGGTVFDPITFLTSAGMGTVSRCVGFGLLGLATGVAIGIVESALKDRWLYVASGPLAGKQFILYKPITTIGSSQSSDIYLFKDTSILPQHGIIELRGAQTFIRSDAPVFVSGAPVRNRALQSGDLIQIGRYAFHFRERQRK
ncbi:MAG TPA: FHA domain-containing protein [Candidatus Angelobacter sp.]|nr:FHA domain-containing protein [Candidatus Angelobacter sp.]